MLAGVQKPQVSASFYGSWRMQGLYQVKNIDDIVN